jgi:hypothetical protein
MDEKAEIVKDKSVSTPFSLGEQYSDLEQKAFDANNAAVYGCIRKNLAMMQLRSVISLVALNLDLEFALGETGLAFTKGARDTLTLTLPPLNLKLKERNERI